MVGHNMYILPLAIIQYYCLCRAQVYYSLSFLPQVKISTQSRLLRGRCPPPQVPVHEIATTRSTSIEQEEATVSKVRTEPSYDL